MTLGAQTSDRLHYDDAISQIQLVGVERRRSIVTQLIELRFFVWDRVGAPGLLRQRPCCSLINHFADRLWWIGHLLDNVDITDLD